MLFRSEESIQQLSKTHINHKNIEGYVTINKNVVKYDKDKQLFIVMNPSGKVLTSTNKSWREYTSSMYDLNSKYPYVDEVY